MHFADTRSTHPTSTQEALQQIVANFQDPGSDDEENPYSDPDDTEAVAQAKKTATATSEFSYTERDVILYNLGLGATEQELHWVFENDDHFAALPSFGVVPQFPASTSLPLDFLPNFNPVRSSLRSTIYTRTYYVLRQSCFTESSTCPSRSQSPRVEHSSSVPGFWRSLIKARRLR